MKYVWLLLLAWATGTVSASEVQPRLILQITVDQLRGDMLPRYREGFGEGGFRRLLEQGAYYSQAHYTTANTFTASGHAALTTGAETSEHGMIGNEWYDRASGKLMYCTADARYAFVGEPTKAGAGMSPANLLSATLGDQLIAANPRSRVFALSGKDRSSIIPGGKNGKAFWWSEATGGFASSRYYYAELPAWLVRWNDSKPIDRYRQETWRPLDSKAGIDTANPHARPNAVLGRTFPHPLLAQSDRLFFGAFKFTPFADELIARLASELIVQEKLGRGEAPDYLSISFSGHDYIGHAYGPESAEYRDSLLRLDRTLAELFALIDREIGDSRTLIVLSSDHGTGEIPEALGLRGADGRIYPDKMRAAANLALRTKLGVADDLVVAFAPPGFYLDRAKLAALALTPENVESALAEHLRSQPSVAHAFTRADLELANTSHEPVFAAVRQAFHPERSGDVMIVQPRGWYMYPDAEGYAAMHGSPYDYDTHVPVLLYGPGVKPRVVAERVSPMQLVPTVAALLGIKPPPACRVGRLP